MCDFHTFERAAVRECISAERLKGCNFIQSDIQWSLLQMFLLQICW